MQGAQRTENKYLNSCCRLCGKGPRDFAAETVAGEEVFFVDGVQSNVLLGQGVPLARQKLAVVFAQATGSCTDENTLMLFCIPQRP